MTTAVALRMRRMRARRDRGTRVEQVVVAADTVSELVKRGLLAKADVEDPEYRPEVLGGLLDTLAGMD